MTRTAPNERTMQAVRYLEQLAYDITRALEHTQRELSQVGVYPIDTLGERTSGGDSTSTWPPESVLSAYELRSYREDLRDWIDGLVGGGGERMGGYLSSGRKIVDDMLRTRTGARQLLDDDLRVIRAEFAASHGEQCIGNGADHPCANWASEHTLADGTVFGLVCDNCWQGRCHVCGRVRDEPRRVDGVPACSACYKKHLRSRAGAA